jgi:hypothetical protein
MNELIYYSMERIHGISTYIILRSNLGNTGTVITYPGDFPISFFLYKSLYMLESSVHCMTTVSVQRITRARFPMEFTTKSRSNTYQPTADSSRQFLEEIVVCRTWLNLLLDIT